MKKAIIWIQIFMLGVLPGVASADEGATEQLKKTYRQIEATYPAYLDNLFRAQVLNYMAWRYQDYLEAMQGLATQASGSWNNLSRQDVKWQALFDAANEGSALDIESSAVELGEILSTVQMESRKLQLIRDDYKLLSDIWEKRCSPQRLEYVYGFFNPTNLYEPNRLDLKAPGAIVTIGFTVSSDYSGGVAAPGFFGEEDGMIITTATAIGASIGSAFPGIGTVVGGVVGAVVGSIIVTVKSIFTWQGEYDEQNDWIKKIRKFQYDRIGGLAVESRTKINGMCHDLMADALSTETDAPRVSVILKANLENIEKMTKHGEELAAKTRSEFQHLEDKLKKQLNTVVRLKLMQAREKFIENVEAIEEELQLSDDGIREMLPSIMKVVAEKRGTVSPLLRSEADQRLWNSMLEAEARHAPSVKFSEFTIWDQTAEFLKAEVVK